MLTGNTVARVGFVLFGVYLLVRFFSLLIDVFGKSTIPLSGDGMSLTATLTTAVVIVAPTFIIGVLLGVLPAVALISRSQRWANRLFPPEEESGSAEHISYVPLFGVGSTLLGLSFAISGLENLAFGLVGVFLQEDDFMRGYTWQLLGSSTVPLLFGVLLIRSGRGAIHSDDA